MKLAAGSRNLLQPEVGRDQWLPKDTNFGDVAEKWKTGGAKVKRAVEVWMSIKQYGWAADNGSPSTATPLKGNIPERFCNDLDGYWTASPRICI
jgi:hypothetical protein